MNSSYLCIKSHMRPQAFHWLQCYNNQIKNNIRALVERVSITCSGIKDIKWHKTDLQKLVCLAILVVIRENLLLMSAKSSTMDNYKIKPIRTVYLNTKWKNGIQER